MKTTYARCLLAVSSAVVLLLAAGCGKTVLITRAPQATAPPLKSERVDGLPFYVKRAYCQQQAAWVEPQFHVKINASMDGAPAPYLGGEATLARSTFSMFNSGTLQEISGKDLKVKTEEGCIAWLSARSEIGALRQSRIEPINEADLDPALQRGDLTLVENSAHVVPYVDYQTVYYYNTARPLTGSSSVDVKLAADGTLTEGSSQVQDATLSSFTGVLSSAVAGLPAAALPAMMSAEQSSQPRLPTECSELAGTTIRLDVSHSVAIYRHTHTFKDPAATELACAPRPLQAASHCEAGCSIDIADVSPAAKNDAPPAAGPKPAPGGAGGTTTPPKP